MTRTQWQLGVISTLAAVVVACAAEDRVLDPRLSAGSALEDNAPAGSGAFQFTPLASSAVCTNGGDPANPLVLPAGFTQTLLASEPSFADAIDMNTQNETGQQAGRYLYRVTEGSLGQLSVTDLLTGTTKIMVSRADWESLDPVIWTPWGTLLFAEETNNSSRRDPAYPAAVGGLVYEVFLAENDPTLVTSVVARPAIGAKSHEGMAFDVHGNLYSISERTPGYIYKFVPDTKGDLSSGQSYVMKITQPDGDRTGVAEWIPLDRAAVQIDASAAGDAVGATGYGRPEDLVIGTSTGNTHGGNWMLYVAITSEHRVLAIDLNDGKGSTFTVSNYVARGLNATTDFAAPDNLALDRSGNLYITEDPGGNTASGKRGDDIWVAEPGKGSATAASSVVRFASLNDCEAEPTGIYFDLKGQRLFVNVQHRGGDRLDKAMAITPGRGK
jgi:uncharacterized protein